MQPVPETTRVSRVEDDAPNRVEMLSLIGVSRESPIPRRRHARPRGGFERAGRGRLHCRARSAAIVSTRDVRFGRRVTSRSIDA